MFRTRDQCLPYIRIVRYCPTGYYHFHIIYFYSFTSEMAIIKCLSFFALVLCSWKYAQACSCAMSHVQDDFCGVDYVILTSIKDKQISPHDPMTVMYKTQIVTIYKSTPEVEMALANNTIYTARDSATCGVGLNMNTKYLLSGYLSENKAHISLCDFNHEWSSLTSYQKKAFESIYKSGCSCKIEWCSSDVCDQNAKDKCILSSDMNFQCLNSFSACVKKNEKCQWDSNDELNKCMKEEDKQHVFSDPFQ